MLFFSFPIWPGSSPDGHSNGIVGHGSVIQNDPAFPIVILIFFRGSVLLKIHAQHALEILAAGEAYLKPLILEAFLDAGEVGVQLHSCFLPQPDQYKELTGGRHLDL